jgi:two-component system, OmpR family, response regulator RegX3
VTARVLVIEDEPAIARAVSYTLAREGFDVETADEGREGLRKALAEPYDLIVLDVMLPGMSGTEICRRLRGESAVSILMLTARNSEIDHVTGLEIGADDYVTKPFSMAELLSRIRAMLRRRELDRRGVADAVRRVGSLELDSMRHQVTVDGNSVHLTPSEFRILALLAEHPERVFTRREIMEHLWQSAYVGDERACEVHISKIRRKIERNAARPARLVTVRGVGYKLLPR